MDITTVLQEVDTWTPEQRLRLVEEVWDRLVEIGHEPGLTEAQRQELDRRIAHADAHPEDLVTWEEVQRHLRRPR